jgi:alpha-tubulin suppressor-like RCC1 family protein
VGGGAVIVRLALVALTAAATWAPTLAAQRAREADVVAIGAGADFTCALIRAGAVFCWGRNDVGQLGLGTSDALAHPGPKRVKLDSAAVSLGVGYDHACATTADGVAYCWGDDRMMESGSPSRAGRCADGVEKVSCRMRPTPVEGGARFRFVAAGFRESCGIAEDRRVLCWGDAGLGHHPVDTLPLERCMPRETGDWCIRHPSPSPAFATREADGTRGHVAFDTIALGAFVNCGVAKGDLHCWGHGVGFPGAWNGVAYPIVGGVDHVSAGLGHACGMRPTLITRCWGERELGALGIGDASKRLDRGAFIAMFAAGPALVDERRMNAVSAGGLHSCGIDAVTRQAMCWGANQWGQLGNGHVDDLTGRAIRRANPEPRFIANESRFALIAAGVDHTCGVTEGGEVLCWGRTRRGATGAVTPTVQPTPMRVRFE